VRRAARTATVDQLELRRLLHREIAGLGALEDLVHIPRGAPDQVYDVRSIGHEPSDVYKLAVFVDRRQAVLGGKVHESSSL